MKFTKITKITKNVKNTQMCNEHLMFDVNHTEL